MAPRQRRLTDAVADAEAERRDDELVRVRRDRDRWRANADRWHRALEHAEERLRVVQGIHALDPKAVRWASPKRPKNSAAVVVALLSDLHLDEVVRADDMGGVNHYDRDVALERLQRWAYRLAQLPQFGPAADIAGIVICMGGDLLNGDIHEGRATNADTLLGSLLFWSEHLASAVDTVAAAYGQVHVPAVVGNHGRMTARPAFKLKARDNADWHIAHLVERASTAANITWQIDESPDALVDVMGRTICFTHGDSTSGGGGIGGIWPPVKRMVARRMTRYAALGRNVDHVAIGHWHQLTYGPDFVVNGSLKGYDEYAQHFSFLPEPPQQAVYYMTDRGMEWRTSIRCDD